MSMGGSEVRSVPAGYLLTIEARNEKVSYNGIWWEPLPIGPATVVTASLKDDSTALVAVHGERPLRLNVLVQGRQDRVGPIIAAVLRELDQ